MPTNVLLIGLLVGIPALLLLSLFGCWLMDLSLRDCYRSQRVTSAGLGAEMFKSCSWDPTRNGHVYWGRVDRPSKWVWLVLRGFHPERTGYWFRSFAQNPRPLR